MCFILAATYLCTRARASSKRREHVELGRHNICHGDTDDMPYNAPAQHMIQTKRRYDRFNNPFDIGSNRRLCWEMVVSNVVGFKAVKNDCLGSQRHHQNALPSINALFAETQCASRAAFKKGKFAHAISKRDGDLIAIKIVVYYTDAALKHTQRVPIPPLDIFRGTDG